MDLYCGLCIVALPDHDWNKAITVINGQAVCSHHLHYVQKDPFNESVKQVLRDLADGSA